MMQDLFFSTHPISYIMILAIIICGYVVANKNHILGVFYFIVELLIVGQYLELVGETPDYWWHIILLLFGGLLTCVYPLWDR